MIADQLWRLPSTSMHGIGLLVLHHVPGIIDAM